MRRLMQPRPRPPTVSWSVVVNSKLIPKSCAQGESHLNIYNSSDNNLKHKHICLRSRPGDPDVVC